MKKTLRIFLGIVFLVSAVLKLQSIDSFEVYFYSLGFLQLNTAYLLARLLISVELLLGILLIMGIYAKKVVIFSALMTGFFTIFLLILMFGNNTEHCHCFGDYLKMSPGLSTIKNVFLLALFAFIYSGEETNIKYKKPLLIALTVISLAIPMIISPPDSFFIEKYASKTSFNEQSLHKFILANNYEKDSKVVCFFSPTCRFCKLAGRKLAVIAEKSGHSDAFQYVFWGSEEKIAKFFEVTHTPVFPYSTLNGHDFLEITDGKMPLIVLLKDGEIKQKYGYRSIQETEILQFLEEINTTGVK